MSTTSKRKSGGSIRLHQRSSSKKSSFSTRKRTSVEEEECCNIREDESKPIKLINYRDELTFYFLDSMFDDIIDHREILSFEDVSLLSKVSDDVVTITMVYKERAPEYELSMIPLEGSKYISFHSKSKTSSKKDSMKEGSINMNGEGESKTSRTPSIDERLGWVIETEDRYECITFKNGNIYRGQTSDYLMHGYGTFQWSDGTSYEGFFKNGYPHGSGKIILTDLSKYEGDFCKCYFHGIGTFHISTLPTVYNGAWKSGKKHGKGWLLYNSNDSYDGEWFEDEKRGFGFRQYKNGSKYKGQWYHNKKNGHGSMLWENNDYYVGDWVDDKLHGYGEYTWNIFFNRQFIFPYYNWYKGAWHEGVRTGAGLMNFGSISGAKLAGIWKDNLKHGPGVMVCGNGLVLQSNPLFENDKPVHMGSPKTLAEVSTLDSIIERGKSLETVSQIGHSTIGSLRMEFQEDPSLYKNCYRETTREINSKIATKTFEDATLTKLTKSGFNISESQFVKLEVSDDEEHADFCPLDIPIHTIAEDVDLEFYFEIIQKYYTENMGRAHFEKSDEIRLDQLVNVSANARQLSISSKENYFQFDKDNEERILRNVITLHLPELTAIYNKYTTIAAREDTNSKSVLIRMFLWQLYRDIKLPHQGITLVEADLLLADNPSSCVDSNHNPFEPIYFWQYLLSLFGCSWLLCISQKSERYEDCTIGTLGRIFKDFLDENLFPNAGKFQGLALTEYKDLFPINCIYKLYLTIGEPHSIRQFLYYTCTKKGKDPPCCAALLCDEKTINLTEGYNAVPISHQIIYLQVKEDLIASRADPPIEDENNDAFSKSLYAFRKLGRKKVIKCLIKICPRIYSDGKVNMDYKLNFLEFYEVLLLCAYETAERKRRLLKIQYEQLHNIKEPSVQMISKGAKDKPGKKKK